MLVPNRNASFDNENYRYGFQGQERDDELKGEGNSINYTFRMHDPRVGRFFSVDPLERSFPYYSAYQFSGNRPIDAVEWEGKEPFFDWTPWLAVTITKMKLSLRTTADNMASPVTKNDDTINNNPFITEEGKNRLYVAKSVTATADLQSKVLLGGTVSAGFAVGGGVLVAESGILSAVSTTISTEFGYFVSSGPLWKSALTSLSIGSVGQGGAWYMFSKGATNFAGQFVNNDFKLNSDINLWQPIPAALSDGLFSNAGESSFKISYSFDSHHEWHFGLTTKTEFISNFSGNLVGKKVGDSFESLVKPITNFSITTKPIFDLYGGTLIEASENKFSDEVKDNLNRNFASPNTQKQKSK